MRLWANKLFYLPIGGLLAAGLLTSAIVLPQTKLAASQDCYGVCASATSLSVSLPVVSETKQQHETFSVKVTAGAGRTGVPTGSAAVKLGSNVVCRIHHLSGGKGSCSLVSNQLKPGSYELVAYYSGDKNFTGSSSREKRVIVLGSSETALSLSKSKLRVSREWDEVFTVKVNEVGRPTARPTGYVKVMTGDRPLCSIHLSHGHGQCSLRGYELRAGSYAIHARYYGSGALSPSTSGTKRFVATKG